MIRRSDKDIINSINKPRGGSIIKVAAVTIVMMVVFAVLLWYIGGIVGTGEGWGDWPSRNTVTDEEEFEQSTLVWSPEVEITETELTGIHYSENGGLLELPINGATGWAAVSVTVRSAANANASAIVTLSPGSPFVILEGEGSWWYVEVSPTVTGWVDNRQCFINLPDVIPSIIYKITNASASIMVSMGNHIPGVTGEPMYSARSFNERLGREEYIVPAMYPLARGLFIAQQVAMEQGNTIIVYEAFRPRATQQAVVSGMQQLMRTNSEVNSVITTPPWGLTHFISTGVSNHQRGAAVDTSIATIRAVEYHQIGEFIFRYFSDYVEFTMPSGMHELSPWSAIVDAPRSISTAQMLTEDFIMRDTVTTGVRRMQQAFARGGFTPLASEWWHFNHTDSLAVAPSAMRGDFFTETIYSREPQA